MKAFSTTALKIIIKKVFQKNPEKVDTFVQIRHSFLLPCYQNKAFVWNHLTTHSPTQIKRMYRGPMYTPIGERTVNSDIEAGSGRRTVDAKQTQGRGKR